MSAPTAAVGTFPYPDHRTMADVLADEADGCFCEMAELDHADDCPIVVAALASEAA